MSLSSFLLPVLLAMGLMVMARSAFKRSMDESLTIEMKKICRHVMIVELMLAAYIVISILLMISRVLGR